MSSLRAPPSNLSVTLYHQLATFAAKYMKNPAQLKQYDSATKMALFEETFMSENDFRAEFAKLERSVGPDWPLNSKAYVTQSSYVTCTLSEKICSYIVNLLYPKNFPGLKTMAISSFVPWYKVFNWWFEDFDFLYYGSTDHLRADTHLKGLVGYLANKRNEINTGVERPALPEILPERVLVQKLIYFLCSLPTNKLPPIKKSAYSIVGFQNRATWRQELGQVYYHSPGTVQNNKTLFF